MGKCDVVGLDNQVQAFDIVFDILLEIRERRCLSFLLRKLYLVHQRLGELAA